MKKHLSLLAVAGLLFVQCSQPDPAEVPDPTLPTVPAVATFGITPEDAAAEALAARDAIAPATRAKRIAVSSILRHDVQTAVRNGQDIDPSLYVVNFEQESGFAIVAADRRQQATVYAVSDAGTFPDPASLEDGALKFLYSRIETLASITPPSTIKPQVKPFAGPWQDDERTNGLVGVKWGIGDPYNQSREVTAFCQIMSFHQWPKTYDWDLILARLQIIIGKEESIKYEENRKAEIKRLFADVAAAMQSGELKSWIGELDYRCNASEAYTYAKVLSEIGNKRPVYAQGSTYYGYIPQKYTWVMDGYLTQHRKITYTPDPVRPGEYPEPVPDDKIEYRTLVHCNLGNDGKGNGFYLSTLFDLHTGPDVPDSGASSKADYVDGQVEYAPSDIRITSNIIPDFYISIIKDSTILIHTDQLTTLKPMPPVE
ncbi:MAG: Spi family protease inhibitor [Alistipes sp.]|jgi:hypothetical protein|uniref:Spi family protease inhibitor n=4 Tax=Rikenellaceae TaxID=171550 RepID=UPI001DF32DF5|nr:Spi family protease inhibitor [Alistipes sp.]MBS6100812.1 Spi family protease inhibitor [Alistipes sp.]HJI20134.1 C10 family peptidase [Rikenellaceae bacterium]